MNLFSDIDAFSLDEVVDILLADENIRIERIVSTGQVSPQDFWYDQQENEFVVVLQGCGHLQFSDGSVKVLRKGDTALIPAHKRHRVSYTSSQPPCIWLCVFYL